MQILASHLISLPVAAIANQSKIGELKSVVFDPENGKVLGFLIKQSIFHKNKLLSLSDILSLDESGAVVRNQDDLVDISEVVRIDKLLKKNIPILGQRAKTESGKNLGLVDDILIDTSTLCITKFYLKSLLQDKILPYEKVYQITSKAVVFQDDVTEGKTVAEGIMA